MHTFAINPPFAQDISYGKEKVPISCINSLDKDFPVYVEYSTKRIPKTDVQINTE